MIKEPIRDAKFTENDVLTERNYQMMLLLVQLDILEGAGSPEGVIEAKTRRFYMDNSAAAGSILYIKQLADIGGDRSQGWILV